MSCGNGGRKCTRDRLQLIGGRIHFGPSHLRGAGSVGVGPELYDLHTATGVNYIPRFLFMGGIREGRPGAWRQDFLPSTACRHCTSHSALRWQWRTRFWWLPTTTELASRLSGAGFTLFTRVRFSSRRVRKATSPTQRFSAVPGILAGGSLGSGEEAVVQLRPQTRRSGWSHLPFPGSVHD